MDCGDTRLYCFQAGCIEAQTRNHSTVQDLVDAKIVTANGARYHPQRGLLFSALGTLEDLNITARPSRFVLNVRDVLLI